MNLVVFGQENLDTLQRQVELIFSQIPDRNVQKAHYNKTLPFTDHLKRIVIFHPVDFLVDTLTILWQLPSLYAYPDNALGEFILKYLNHQQDGSIFRYLQTHNLAFKVTARINDSDTYSLLYIQVFLTRAGFRELKTVIKVIFDFLDEFRCTAEDGKGMKIYWKDFLDVTKIQKEFERIFASVYVK